MTSLPEVGFLRVKQVLRLIPVSKSTWWNGVKSGRFPKPIKNGKCSLWKVETVKELIEQMAGDSHG